MTALVEFEALAFDLRTEAEIELQDRIALFREHLDRDDFMHPGRQVKIRVPKGHYRAGERVPGVRCLRCGKAIYPYDRVIGHDLGWCGCYDQDGRRQFKDAAEMNRGRAELEYFPPCRECKHAWGLHATHLNKPPAIARRTPGGGAAYDWCYTWCGCRRYVAPPMARTPWGTCPGCWAPPHRGPCG